MRRWEDDLDDSDVALELGLECAECGKFSGPVAHGWRALPADEEESLEPLVFLCPLCVRRATA